MTLDSVARNYDEEPYANLTHSQTHPDLLATIGRLLGMTPAPVDHCRVLELGCAAGANIAALAEVLPGTEFVGIDYSEREILEGKEALRQMGLSNVRLHSADIRALEPLDLGTFDYIIAHGVYSWVPADVRERLLAACKTMLNPHGIAYVSYNAYPGWHMMRGIHDALRYRTREAPSRRERAAEAEAFARFLRTAVTPSDGPYSQLVGAYEPHIESRRRTGGDRGVSLLLHDDLAEVNDPFYFHEFAAQAASHELQYLADADFPSVFPTKLQPEAQAELRVLARDVVELQQYMDFITNASFRRTLLCHGHLPLSRRLGTDLKVFRRLVIGSPARPEAGDFDLSPDVVQTFIGDDGARLVIDSPVGKAAMSILCERYPSRLPFPELLAEACSRLEPRIAVEGNAEAQLVAVLLQGFCYSFSLVEMGTLTDRFTMAPGTRPKTSAFARLLAEAGVSSVTNLRHQRLSLDAFRLHLVSLFDGTRTEKEILDRLLEDVEAGALQANDRAMPAGDARARLGTALGQAIESLTEVAMFLA
jgi:methyltransferase-like protein/trans-aconitate methyltransferase